MAEGGCGQHLDHLGNVEVVRQVEVGVLGQSLVGFFVDEGAEAVVAEDVLPVLLGAQGPFRVLVLGERLFLLLAYLREDREEAQGVGMKGELSVENVIIWARQEHSYSNGCF